MDQYTKKTKEWLEARYREVDEKGFYNSFAPIYGFNKKHKFLGWYKNYYTIIKTIEVICAEYKIDTFLEVGCAEGFLSHLIKEIFGFKVNVCDLSSEAIKRAQEIYGLKGFVIDIQAMDTIKDNSFDMVLCSETVEHVPNPDRAFRELLRITKKILIVTVPAAKNKKEKESFIPHQEPHSHLNVFTKEEIKKLFPKVEVRGILSIWLNRLEGLFTEHDNDIFYKKSKCLLGPYKILRLLFSPLRRLYGPNLAKIFIALDYLLCNKLSGRVNTYMGIFRKIPQEVEGNYKSNRKLLDYILYESKVVPYILKKY